MEEEFKIITPDQVDTFTKDEQANLLLGAGYSLKIDNKGFIRGLIPPVKEQPEMTLEEGLGLNG
ncbi:MAG: hypothetical protein ACHQ1D_00775 [Nitrososphaerales archaeon]